MTSREALFKMYDHIPKGWKTEVLYNLADFINGKAFKQSELGNKGLPIIKIAELHNGITSSTKYYDGKVEEWFYLKGGELLFAWSGSIGIFVWNNGPAVLNQHIFKVKAKAGVDQKFLRYLLQYHMPIFELLVKDKTTTMGHVTVQDLKHIETAIPQLPEQRKIADILGSLDDKIGLNYEMNKTLEAIAQAIFKNWFVDFGPFKDKLVYNEELGKGIPNGWEMVNYSSLVNYTFGYPFDSQRFNDKGLGSPVIRIRDLPYNKAEIYTTEKVDQTYVARQGEILVGMDGEFRAYIWKGLEVLLNQRIVKITPKENVPRSYLYYVIMKPLSVIEASKIGTTVIHLNKADLDEIRVILPDKAPLERFAEVVEPLIDLQVCNIQENQVLEQLRDALLPKLLSGEIRVKVDVQEEFPEETKKLEEIIEEKVKLQESLEKWFK